MPGGDVLALAETFFTTHQPRLVRSTMNLIEIQAPPPNAGVYRIGTRSRGWTNGLLLDLPWRSLRSV